MKTDEVSGKRKRAPPKTFVPAESQKKMRVSKRDKKGKVQYDDVSIKKWYLSNKVKVASKIEGPRNQQKNPTLDLFC